MDTFILTGEMNHRVWIRVRVGVRVEQILQENYQYKGKQKKQIIAAITFY